MSQVKHNLFTSVSKRKTANRDDYSDARYILSMALATVDVNTVARDITAGLKRSFR